MPHRLNTNKQFMIGNGILAFAVIIVVVIFVYMSLRVQQQKRDERHFLEQYTLTLDSTFRGHPTSVYLNDSLLVGGALVGQVDGAPTGGGSTPVGRSAAECDQGAAVSGQGTTTSSQGATVSNQGAAESSQGASLTLHVARFAEQSALLIVDDETERISFFQLDAEGGVYTFSRLDEGGAQRVDLARP